MSHPQREAPSNPRSVVGLGASAGGLTALQRFLAALEGTDVPAAFVVLMHLLPERESRLAELLQPFTTMPVRQVTGEVPLELGHVYVLPPGHNLSALDTHLRITPIEDERRLRAPIDHFFRTMAKVHDGRSIAVVLTGTGSDGSLGLREVKEQGGLTIVQAPKEAEYDGMPQSAIATGAVDLVIPIAEMPAAIKRFVTTEPRLRTLEAGESDVHVDERTTLQRIFAQLRARTGRDFTHYKSTTILRRISRRMQILQVDELSEYLELLRAHPDESHRLADELLITVTSFFRDPDVFDTLAAEVIPRLFAGAGSDGVRVWSVGCASGEEAYGLAILLLEEAAQHEVPSRVHVFASDLHEQSLARAREGFFPGDIAVDVRPDRLAKYFTPEGGGYRIRKEVREIVLFAPHNLLGDPPFSRLDLVVCRNLLIYLQRDMQRDVIELFHYALKPEGALVLGSSETVDGLELFQVESKKQCIYRKRNVPTREPRLPVFPVSRPSARRVVVDVDSLPVPVPYGALHQRMVESYAPPSMLVSPDDKIVHLSEHAGAYLVHSGGEITANAIKLVREELRVELRSALYAARERALATRTPAIAVDVGGATRDVVLHVRPALEPRHEGFILVIFDDQPPARSLPSGEVVAVLDGTAPPVELQAELEMLRQRLQGLVEAYETGQEEMKASNEELQSANEELRSTMEELETGREELQSMNEELQSVNQENRHKVEELTQLSDDLQNLLSATDIATLFLDRELRILRFTPKVGELFNMRTVDGGRPISDLTHRLGYVELIDDAEKVLRQLIPVEREVSDERGHWYLARVLPYRSGEDRIAGVVITFVDITALKRAEEASRTSERFHRMAVDAGRIGTWDLDLADGTCLVSPRMSELAGCPPTAQVLERAAWVAFIGAADRPRIETMLDRCAATGEAFEATFPLQRRDGEVRWLYSRGAVTIEASSPRMHGACVDITDRLLAEEALREADRRKDEFLAMLGHELRNPLAALQSALTLLEPQAGTPSATRLLEIAGRQASNLGRIVDDLLDVARVMRGMIELRPVPTDVCELAVAALHSMHEVFAGRQQHTTINVGSAAIITMADPVRLEQVIVNLLTNASKFSAEGGHIDLSVQRVGDQIEIAVTDDGIGLDPELQTRVFDLFHQGKQDLARSTGGLGIGLAVVRRLVGLHSGSVEAESAGENLGSRFVVRIPASHGTTLPAAPRPSAPAPADLSVLVVDDNRDAATLLSELIGLMGHRVRVAHHARDALQLLANQAVDVAFLDIGLPDVDGFELATAIRALPGSAPKLIAVTGYGGSSDRDRSRRAGFAEHLLKPITLDQLRSVLGAVSPDTIEA